MMTAAIPQGAPTDIGAAFAHINSVTAPTVDDLKIMVLVEAAGLELYGKLAAGTDNAAVAALLQHNGREEMAHAHRVAKAITALCGEDYPPPPASENPYLATKIPETPLTVDKLRGLALGEVAGDTLYGTWAANIGNEEAARLFRLNGKEELDHAARLHEAAELLEA